MADRGVLTAAHREQQQTQAWMNYLLVGMIVAYTAISVVNTLVLATARRRREFAVLAVAATLLPTWKALRSPPAEAAAAPE